MWPLAEGVHVSCARSKRLLTVAKFAARLRVHAVKVQAMVAAGRIKALVAVWTKVARRVLRLAGSRLA
jgi:hypothetical protein